MNNQQGIRVPAACPDCKVTLGSLMELMAHWEEGCPATNVSVVIGITLDGHVFSVPEFEPTPELPDLPALLRYMADVVVPE